MILSDSLLENSKGRIPDNMSSLISQAKENPSILKNPAVNLQQRSLLLTEANVPATVVNERILGGNDYQDINYFLRGIEAGAAVCRIIVNRNGVSYGTGFLISESLIMTNNHVLEDELAATGAIAEFDYELDHRNNYKAVTRVAIRPEDFFYTSKVLDYTIVAIAVPQSSRSCIRLIAATGKAVYNESLSIIQHPDGREKKVAVRNNIYITSTDTTIWYTTDTSPGSSGSPVFNDDWQLVALHHSGVPERTDTGKFVLIDGTVVDSLDNIQESKIRWKANEGIRISAIVGDLGEQLSGTALDHFPKIRELMDVIRHTALENVSGAETVNILPLQSEINQILQSKPLSQAPDSQSLSLSASGLQITINIGGLQTKDTTSLTSGIQSVSAEEAKPKLKIKIDPDYAARPGYQSAFLNLPLALDAIVAGVTAKKNIRLSTELKYHHFSIFQADEVWKMPYITAVNIYGEQFQDYNRPQDAWYPDPRLTGLNGFSQLSNQIYKNNNLDKGHMVRREDPSWGTPEEALLATFDTYHYTNACPQHSLLNQGKMEWQGLENYILNLAVKKKLKISVFTGPVLTDDPAEYKMYRDIRVPMQFYKIVVVNSGNAGVYAAGYLLSQYQYSGDFEASYDPTVDQKPIADIMKLTAMDFSSLLSVDTFGRATAGTTVLPEESLRELKMDLSSSFRLKTISDIALSLKDPA